MNGLLKWLMKITVKKFCAPLEKAVENPYEAQEKILLKIVKTSRNTFFGRRHDFKSINSIEEYQRRVPVLKYSDYKPLIKRVIQGEENVLTPYKPVHIAQTSGTTGKPKIIPLSKPAIKEFGRMSARIFASYINEDKENARILDGKFLLFMAPAIDYYINNIPVGYISGINAVNQNKIFQKMVIPPLSILNEKDWNIKFYKTAQIAVKSNITLAGGVTPLLLSLFQKILEDYNNALPYDYMKNNNLEGSLTKIWPNFKVLLHSGVNVKPYLTWMRSILGEHVNFRDCYGATEGVFAFQIGENNGMTLNLDTYFYEFIPADELKNEEPKRYLADELKRNIKYTILVTTSNGLYSYLISDIVEAATLNPLTIRVVGRLNGEISLAGEKMDERSISEAVYEAILYFNLQVNDFTIIPVYDGKPRYRFLIEFKNPPRNTIDFLKTLDQSLRKHNQIYNQCRLMGLIDNPEMVILPLGTYRKFKEKQAAEGKPIGQMKIPRVASNSLIEETVKATGKLDVLSY
ncbi:MAG: GH3 auxin-responsive promoter family protein [Candidatus Odinarchaeum yellowstonii]|uniref:GH3 auxin-responsive promoter family protein n=1 Tax=Odinarchaeota yellowstonii (strain LCB_4) TaxID=1841599 RepID=A0AAF0D2H8_ODILC|nr:MAG: GH3 auxin-responsive promoter family protein [Candidatus Odinarchaeum yellowstonii]